MAMGQRPHFKSLSHLLQSAATLTGQKRIASLSAALTALCDNFGKGEKASKVLSLAGKLARYDVDLAIAWVDGIIVSLLAGTESGDAWFAKPKACQFLFAMNIACGTFRETRLRLIADYALSKFLPKSEDQLRDHLRITALFIEQFNENGDVFPSGPVYILRKVLADRSSFGFFVSQKVTAAATKLFEEMSTLPTIYSVYPELSQGIPSNPQFKRIHELAEKAKQQRIESFRTKRVFPPMIQMIPPQLDIVPKYKSEEDRLRKVLKNETRKVKRAEREAAKEKLRVKMEEKEKRKEERENVRKKVMSMMESERNYDLNMAAADGNAEEDKNDESDSSSDESE
jgi:hypothetical protein